MLDLNRVRAEFAAYLSAHAGTKNSLDAALMHVVTLGYTQGLKDGVKGFVASNDGHQTTGGLQ